MMESLAYLHVALAHEAEAKELVTLNFDLPRFVRQTQSGLLSGMVILGVMGIAEAALAQSQRLLKRGMAGADVTEVQSRLKTLGHFEQNVAVTRYFGSITQRAVVKFQRAEGLQADGIVGTQTWSALFKTASSSPEASTKANSDASPFNTSSFTNSSSSSSPFNTKSFIEPLPIPSEFSQDLSLQQSSNTAQSFPRGLVLRRGSRGNNVRKLQELLQSKGFNPSGGIDGVYGSRTVNAVRQFQRDRGLTPDGIAGSRTLTSLSQ